MLLGRLADETLLGSVRAVPEKLLADGFRFEDDELRPALQRCLFPIDPNHAEESER
jgi:NAD dependent epimerase/dehydratase family enzyme